MKGMPEKYDFHRWITRPCLPPGRVNPTKKSGAFPTCFAPMDPVNYVWT
jgi:hypothetical protein